MHIHLSALQARVYFIVKDHGPIGPSRIGQELDFKYENASGSVMRPLSKLVELGLCDRIMKNKRVVRYKVRDGIHPVFEIKGGDDSELTTIRGRAEMEGIY